MSLPYIIIAGTDIEAAPVQGNFENLDLRVAANEAAVDNLAPSASQYDNGVFIDGLTASQVSTSLVYTAGSAVVGKVWQYKSTLTIPFSGEAADTYYVEMDNSGTVDIYTSHDSSRTNLNTVVWNGAGFDSVTTADRNILYGDDQFVVLAGRTGGQTIQGSTDSGGNLILESTSHATKGVVRIKTASIQEKITNQSSALLTLDAEDSLIICDSTSNAIAITLPDANTVLGQVYDIYVKTVLSSNDVTITTASGDTFNLAGNNTITLTEEDFVQIVAIDANRWYVRINNNAVLSTV